MERIPDWCYDIYIILIPNPRFRWNPYREPPRIPKCAGDALRLPDPPAAGTDRGSGPTRILFIQMVCRYRRERNVKIWR